MKAKFISTAVRVGYFILFLILVAAEVGSIYITLTDFNEETAIFAASTVIWIVPAILCLLTAILSGGAELTLDRGRLAGTYRHREFRCAVADVKMLYCHSSKKGGEYLYLRTSEGSYHFFGITNAEEMRNRIAAELPLPADCRNASDELLQTRLNEKKRIFAKWNGLTIAVALVLVAAGGGGLFALAKKLHLFIALSCAAVAVIAAICLTRISKIASWHKLLRDRLHKEFTRRKIGNIDDYPKGYTDVVKVIYQENYEFRVIVRKTEEGYVCVDEYWNEELDPPAWEPDVADINWSDVVGELFNEDEDEDEEEETEDGDDSPKVFKTMKELDEYLDEEGSVFDVEEIVYFE